MRLETRRRIATSRTGVCLRDRQEQCRGNHEGTAYGRVVAVERNRRSIETTLDLRPFDERERCAEVIKLADRRPATCRSARIALVIKPPREVEEWPDLATQIADLIGSKRTGKEHKAMIARAIGAIATVLISFGNQASAELARDIYLAIRKARGLNTQAPSMLLSCGTDLWESEAHSRHQMLENEVAGGPPRLYQVHYSRRHAGTMPIQVETDDAWETCGIRRGDTVYFAVMRPRDLKSGDIAGSYWCEVGKRGWQTFIGRIEVRPHGEIVATNDKESRVVEPSELVRITAVEKPLDRERFKDDEEWPEVVGERDAR